MTSTVLEDRPVEVVGTAADPPTRPTRDLQRTFQLLLATVWLLDAVLQLQPFMFTKGSSGFSGMLDGLAAGNPGWVSRTITWNGSIVEHHAVLTNTLFAGIQFVIAFGIVGRRTVRPALALSVVWSLGVWWFGEGAGGIFHGAATPFGGGPGGVLFYAVIAVLLWPSGGSDEPFVAARTVGVRAARAVWAGWWGLLALLAVVGAGRSPQALHDLVATLDNGSQPGWLAHLDKVTESFLLHHGTTVAVLFAVLAVAIAASVYLPPPVLQTAIVVAVVLFAVIWVTTENVGGILAGGATDPNSGLPMLLLVLLYWPLTHRRPAPADLTTGKA